LGARKIEGHARRALKRRRNEFAASRFNNFQPGTGSRPARAGNIQLSRREISDPAELGFHFLGGPVSFMRQSQDRRAIRRIHRVNEILDRWKSGKRVQWSIPTTRSSPQNIAGERPDDFVLRCRTRRCPPRVRVNRACPSHFQQLT
jgi:hypothetical protein